MAESKEVATLDRATVEKLGPMARVLVGIDPPLPLDPELVSARIRAAVLTAETPEQAFAAGATTPLEELFGVPLLVVSAHLLPSSLEGDNGKVFMVLEVERGDDGSRVITTTSAGNVMDLVASASDHGWVDFRFKVRRSERQSAQGFYPYIVESV